MPTDEGDDPLGTHPDAVEREFDWRGWALVGALFVAFLVIPGIIYLYPRIPTNAGLSFWDTYLVLPLIPALVLGTLAVWATTRP
jgi:ABC-type glycerol-3-phosphate transport system permease component